MTSDRGASVGWMERQDVQLALLSLFSLTVFFAKLGLNGMANYDDCFYAEKAKEILQNHEWWILTFDHRPAFENPPFFMWLLAFSYKLFGISVFAAKFPSALMGFLNVLLIYFFGQYLFNRWVGFYAAFILASTYPFFKYSRHAMLDVTLTFFVASALFCLLLALRKDSRFFILWGFLIGCAILIKSVLGLFPLVISAAFILWFGKFKKILNLSFVLGCLIILLWGGSWYGVEYQRFGMDFARTHFGWLIFQRGFVLAAEPWYHHLGYFADLATYYWPWLPLAAAGFVLAFQRSFWKNENLGLLVFWIVILIGVMSFMNARVFWYIMPVFPASALLSAYALDHFFNPESKVKMGKVLAGVILALVLLLNLLPIPLDKDREKDTRVIAPYVKYFGDHGAKVISLREEFYGLNNALMFFSDYAADPLYTNVSDIQKEFAAKNTVICVAHQGDLGEIQKTLRVWYPVKYGGDLVLISNQKLDVSGVPVGGG